jgi:hypothetical protein
LEDRLWVTTRGRPLIRRAQTRLFFRCPNIVWSFGRRGLLGIFYDHFVYFCVSENSFARGRFDNLQTHEGSEGSIRISKGSFLAGENYKEEFKVIGSKWRKRTIFKASEPRYAS